jgi:hypothetical protein
VLFCESERRVIMDGKFERWLMNNYEVIWVYLGFAAAGVVYWQTKSGYLTILALAIIEFYAINSLNIRSIKQRLDKIEEENTVLKRDIAILKDRQLKQEK